MLGCRGLSLAVALVPAWLGQSSAAQTVVPGGTTLPISADDLEANGSLEFSGGGGPAILLLTAPGATFTNLWSIDNAHARFELGGETLTLSPSALGSSAAGATILEVADGTLVLGTNSFLAGFTGTLQVGGDGAMVIQEAAWFSGATVVNLDSTGGAATLTWDGAAAAIYSGALNLSGGNVVTVATVQDASSLTLNGTVGGAGDLRLLHTIATASPTIVLDLAGGFTGRTILESVNARIDTQESIGSAGLTLDGATLTAGTTLTIGGSQTLVVANDSTIVAAAGPTGLTIEGEMQGSGNLVLDQMNVTIGGADSSYTGAVSLQGSSTLTVSNAEWMASAGGLLLNADGVATTFTWGSADDAAFTGDLDVGTGGIATIATAQDTGSIALSGAVSGTADLRLLHTGVTATAAPSIVLGLTGGFTGRTILESVNARIDTQASIGSAGLTLDGATLTVGTPAGPDPEITILDTQTLVVVSDSTIAGTTAGGLTAMTVNGEMQGAGNLTISGMAMTVNGATTTYTGVVSLQGGTALTVSNDAWLGSVTSISMNADDAATSLIYSGAAGGSYAGLLDLGDGTATVSSTEDFSLTGTVSGTGNLLVTREAGSSAVIGLDFDGSLLSGTTIVSATEARLLTASSVGVAGLTLASGDLTIDAALGSLTIGAAQDLTVTGTSSITGSGGASALTVDGDMAGNGTLAVEGLAMTVNGAASAFTGGVALGTGSSLTTGNTAWVEGLGALRFDASATVEYSGAADATFDGLLSLSANPATPTDATFRSVGAGSGGLTLSGFASGSGNLVVENTGGSTSAFTLALTGSFDGTTTVNDADVTINTQGSVGQDGLTLNTTTVMDATIGAPLAFGSAQLLTIGGTVNMSGGTANAAINAQGGLHSAAAAALNLDDIDLTVGDGTASTFTGDISLTDGATLTLDGADLGTVDLASIAGGAEVTIGGSGTIGSIGGVAPGSGFAGQVGRGLDITGASPSILAVTNDVVLDTTATMESVLRAASGTTGTADRVDVGGTFNAGDATLNLLYPAGSASPLVPLPGVTQTYTIVTAAARVGEFDAVNLVNGTSAPVALDASGTTAERILNGSFQLLYQADRILLSILGIGGPAPLPPSGTTSTNVLVTVEPGVVRNANVGIVSNAQINESVDEMNLLAQTATGDTDVVATQILLQTDPGAYASSVVAVSGPANPYALPTTLMLGMSEAGDVAMERLMQLRPQMTAPQAPPRQRGTGGPRSTAVAQSVATTRRKAFGAELNGPTPDEGMRGWARGFGFTGSFSNQNWAQTSYDSTLGNVAAGVDTVVGDGGILGGFVGYIPGSVSVTGGLVDESMTLNGVDFGMYGSWVPNRGEWYLSGAVTGAYTMIDRTRNIYVPGVVRTATSSSNAWSASFMGETGFNLPAGGDSYISPYVRVAYNYFNQGSYTESGAGSLNLAVGSQSASALQPSFGARYMDGIRSGRSVITPFVGAAFTAFVPVGDWGVTATNPFTALPPISVYGDVETLYGASVEAGVEVALPDGLTLFASFNGMFLSDTQVLGGRAGIQIPF